MESEKRHERYDSIEVQLSQKRKAQEIQELECSIDPEIGNTEKVGALEHSIDLEIKNIEKTGALNSLIYS